MFFVLLCFVQLSEDHDRPAGPGPDRGEREEEAQTAGAAGTVEGGGRGGGEGGGTQRGRRSTLKYSRS